MLVDMNNVAWLSKAEIEQEAHILLLEWSAFAEEEIKPPIPVEAIIEKHLGITLEYDDLDKSLGIPGVLGATWVNEKRMAINSSLLDGVEGRIAFTCGHEVGHWILHRSYFFEQFSRLGQRTDDDSPAIICRTSASKQRGEWQADHFSGTLLMPEMDVREAYAKVFGQEPLILYNEKSCFGRHNPIVLDPALDTVKEIAQEVIDQGAFTNVSREAMVYRLLDLGLLINSTGKSLGNHFASISRAEPSPRPAG
jgi:Zn-dependent peptidase ImmA (M78 family)